jgi:hypothetical protein
MRFNGSTAPSPIIRDRLRGVVAEKKMAFAMVVKPESE